MTERGRRALRRDQSSISIGPSGLFWDDGVLTIDIAEVTVPLPSQLRGRVRVHPLAVTDRAYALDAEARHRWWPIAPCARVEVEMTSPKLSWQGDGYLDSNAGDEPLAAGFKHWHWSRAKTPGGSIVLYDSTWRNAGSRNLALQFDESGGARELEPFAATPLPSTGWRIRRATQADEGHGAKVLETLEDTPFYARSVIASHLLGEPVIGVHESLSLDRFRTPVVQFMLPFRMPRAF